MAISEKASTELIRCVLFALKHMDMRHRGALMFKVDENGNQKMLRWEDDFVNALSLAGIEIDKEKLAAVRNDKKKKPVV